MDISQAELTLYTYFRSSCSARVRTAAALKGVVVRTHVVNLLQGQQSDDTYKDSINPSGTVPTLVVSFPDGKHAIIRQSIAILEFLEEAFPSNPPLLPPIGQPLERAAVRDIVNVLACDVQPKTNFSLLKRLRQVGIESSAWCREQMEPGLQAVNAILRTSSSQHCVGDSVTLADVVLAPAVEAALRFDIDLVRFPEILKAYNACKSLPEFVQADWKHQEDTPAQFREG